MDKKEINDKPVIVTENKKNFKNLNTPLTATFTKKITYYKNSTAKHYIISISSPATQF